MKAIIAVLLAAVSMCADAKVLAQSINSVGGLMMLTDDPCPNSESHVAITTEAGGANPERGCWVVWQGRVYIKWDALNQPINYPVTDFKEPSDA